MKNHKIEFDLLESRQLLSNYTTLKSIENYYGFNQLQKQYGVSGGGADVTVAIVDAFNDPYIVKNINKFSYENNLPKANLSVYNLTDANWNEAVYDGWNTEISLDVEIIHALAPYAKIDLVEAFGPDYTSMIDADAYASQLPGVSIISNSWGGTYLYNANIPNDNNAIYIASAGDNYRVPLFPSTLSDVISVGATQFHRNHKHLYESSWNQGGGGYGIQQPPNYQSVLNLPYRSTPDVSMLGGPPGIKIIYGGNNQSITVYGTSQSCPEFGALLADINGIRLQKGLSLLTTSEVQQKMYSVYNTNQYGIYFNDIVKGRGTSAGYDQSTGLGSPTKSFYQLFI